MWRYDGSERPPFADRPRAGQESVWDYPRPPRLAPDDRHVVVHHGDVVIADTRSAIRVLETASPPTFYLPPEDIDLARVRPAAGTSFCEWKGVAEYWSLRIGGELLERVAWSYRDPLPAFIEIAGYLSFYPAHVDCSVDGARVRPQPGGFYGGWVTPEIVGPFKGEGDSVGW